MEQEEILINEPQRIYRQLVSGLSEGEDILTDATQIYDKDYKVRQSEINKFLIERIDGIKDRKETLLVSLYKMVESGIIILTDELRNMTILQMLLNGWLYSSNFSGSGDIYRIQAIKDQDNQLQELEDGFLWTQAEFFARSSFSFDNVLKSAYLTIFVKDCLDAPLTPTGGTYNFDTKILKDIVWKDASGLNLTWLLSVPADALHVYLSNGTVYSDSGTITWSTPTRLILNSDELFQEYKGTMSIAVELYSKTDNPSTESIRNLFYNPKLAKEGDSNPWVIQSGTTQTKWNESTSTVWKTAVGTDGVVWKTSRVCVYDEDTNLLTGTDWSTPVKFIDIDGIISKAESDASTAALTAIQNATQSLTEARLEATDITNRMTEAAGTLATLKELYLQGVSESINKYAELEDKYDEYFGEGGKVDVAISDLNKEANNTDAVVQAMQALGGYLNPYTVSKLLLRATDGEKLYIVGDVNLKYGEVITDGKLTYYLAENTKTLLVVQGKYYRAENFTETTEFGKKTNIIICGNYNAATKLITDSYVVDPDNIKAELREYKNYTNGALSRWGIIGEGVKFDKYGNSISVTSLETLIDAAAGIMDTKISNANNNFVTSTELLQTAERIEAKASDAKFILQGEVTLAPREKKSIKVSDNYKLWGSIVDVDDTSNKEFDVRYTISIQQSVGDYVKLVTEPTFEIPASDILAKKDNTEGAENDYKIFFKNDGDSTVKVSLKYTVEAALASFGVGAHNIAASVAEELKSDNQLVLSIGDSVLTSTSFKTSVSLTIIDDYNSDSPNKITKLSEIKGDIDSIKSTVGQWLDNSDALTALQAQLLITASKIEGTVLEAKLVPDSNSPITLTESSLTATITLPKGEKIKDEDTSYYNSPYYILYSGGELEYDNNGTWNVLSSGSRFDLGSTNTSLSIRVKTFNESNTTKTIEVKFGYNQADAMSKTIQTSKSIALYVYSGSGYAALKTEVDNVTAEVFESDGTTSKIGSLSTRVDTIEGRVGKVDELSTKYTTLTAEVEGLKANAGDINYSDLKKLTLTSDTALNYELPYSDCSYKISFTGVEKIQYALSGSTILEPDSYTEIINNGSLDVTTFKILWIKYSGSPSTIDVNIKVQTATMVSKLNITPQYIAASVTDQLGVGGDENLKTALLNITSDNISSILTKTDADGNIVASSSIIQAINGGGSSTAISSDKIVLNGDVIAKSIATKALNVDNLTYIFSKLNKKITESISNKYTMGIFMYENGGLPDNDPEIDFTNKKGSLILGSITLEGSNGAEAELSGYEYNIVGKNNRIIKLGAKKDDVIYFDNESIRFSAQKPQYEFNNIYDSFEIDNGESLAYILIEYNVSYEGLRDISDKVYSTPYTSSTQNYPLMLIGAGTNGLSAFRSDGSGYLAGGLISWDKYKIENGVIKTSGGIKQTGGSNMVLDIQGFITAKGGSIGGWTIALDYLWSKNSGNIMQISPTDGIKCCDEDASVTYYQIQNNGTTSFSKGKALFNSNGTFRLGNETEYILLDDLGKLTLVTTGLTSVVKSSVKDVLGVESGDELYTYIDLLVGNVSVGVGNNLGLKVNDDATYLSNGTAGFYTGPNAPESLSTTINTVFNGNLNPGCGYLASGNIKWNGSGTVNVNGNITATTFQVNPTNEGFGDLDVSTGVMWLTTYLKILECEDLLDKDIQGLSDDVSPSTPMILVKDEVGDFFVLNPLHVGEGAITEVTNDTIEEGLIYDLSSTNTINVRELINSSDMYLTYSLVKTTTKKYHSNDDSDPYESYSVYNFYNSEKRLGSSVLYKAKIKDLLYCTQFDRFGSLFINPLSTRLNYDTTLLHTIGDIIDKGYIEVTRYKLSGFNADKDGYENLEESSIYIVPNFEYQENPIDLTPGSYYVTNVCNNPFELGYTICLGYDGSLYITGPADGRFCSFVKPDNNWCYTTGAYRSSCYFSDKSMIKTLFDSMHSCFINKRYSVNLQI